MVVLRGIRAGLLALVLVAPALARAAECPSADQLREWLAQRRYDEMEAWFHRWYRLGEQNEQGGPLLHGAYVSLARLSLDKDLRDRPEEWTDLRPESASAWTVRGFQSFELAWQARGTGYASTIHASDEAEYARHLRDARSFLEKAAQLDPPDPSAEARLIRVAMMEGAPRAEIELHFRRAIGLEPYFLPAYQSKLTALQPRWGGNAHDLLAFARDAARGAPEGSWLPLLLANAHEDLASWEGKSHWNDPRAWEETRAAYDRVIEDHPTDWHARNAFALAANLAGRLDTLREQLAAIGDHLERDAWHGYARAELARRRAEDAYRRSIGLGPAPREFPFLLGPDAPVHVRVVGTGEVPRRSLAMTGPPVAQILAWGRYGTERLLFGDDGGREEKEETLRLCMRVEPREQDGTLALEILHVYSLEESERRFTGPEDARFLEGWTSTLKTDALHDVTYAGDPPPRVPPRLTELRDELMTPAATWCIPVPEEPLGVGGKWEVHRVVERWGDRLTQDSQCTVTGIDEQGVATLAVKITREASAADIQVEGLALDRPARRQHVLVVGRGEARIAPDRALPIHGQIDMDTYSWMELSGARTSSGKPIPDGHLTEDESAHVLWEDRAKPTTPPDNAGAPPRPHDGRLDRPLLHAAWGTTPPWSEPLVASAAPRKALAAAPRVAAESAADDPHPAPGPRWSWAKLVEIRTAGDLALRATLIAALLLLMLILRALRSR